VLAVLKVLGAWQWAAPPKKERGFYAND
jgi:hypothetical protein